MTIESPSTLSRKLRRGATERVIDRGALELATATIQEGEPEIREPRPRSRGIRVSTLRCAAQDGTGTTSRTGASPVARTVKRRSAPISPARSRTDRGVVTRLRAVTWSVSRDEHRTEAQRSRVNTHPGG